MGMSAGAGGRMNEHFVLDGIDRAIVRLLRENGRATNQQIAHALELTAATVSSRIRRMEDANILRAIAVSDFAVHGYNMLMQVAIEVDGRLASEVATELADLPEVFAAHLVSGQHDIDMLVALRSAGELSDFVLEKIAPIRGIRTAVPAIITDVIKYNFGDWRTPAIEQAG